MAAARTLAEHLNATVTEKELLQLVEDTARRFGWLTYHTHDSRRSEPGFPDLVLCKPETGRYPAQLLYVELKSETGRVSAAQIRWLDALKANRVEVHIWRPSDWPAIQARLRQREDRRVVA